MSSETAVETTRMSTKGQVIIPKDIREFVEAQENTLFSVAAVDKETIILKKIDREKILRSFKRITKSINEEITEEEINAIIKDYRRSKSSN